MREKWDWSYVTLQQNDQRFTLKIVHYQSFDKYGDIVRAWWRLYPENFDLTKTASEQPFGFGKTFEECVKRYTATLVMNAT